MRKKILKIAYICIIIIILMHINVYALIVPKNENVYIEENSYDKIVRSIYDYNIEKNGLISKDVNVGDEVVFGRFVEPIDWKVLDKKDGKVLLISKHIIYTLPYNNTWNPITWENSTIRKWLNDDFYKIAFYDCEKEQILDTYNENHDNYVYKTKSGNNTIDKVFILSMNEVKKYFQSYESRKTYGTEYSKKNNLWISKSFLTDGYSVWWLRTAGKNTSYASLVYAGGTIGEAGDGVATTGNGIRPCIWVKVG